MAKCGKRTRWGVVGCGMISEDMASAMKLLPEEEHTIVAVGASSLDKAQKYVDKFSLSDATAYGSYSEVYANKDVDVVYIGLLNTQHKDAVLEALEAGRNILCEKPLGLSVKEVREMIDKAREKKVFFMEAYWSRFFPVYKKLKEELKEKSIGDVMLMQGDYGIDGTLPRQVELELGGGFLYDIGCYLVQLALLAFNHDKPELITAVGWKRDGVDNAGSVTLKFSGERMAQLLYNGNFYMKNQAVIYGTKGHLLIPEEFNHPETLTKYVKEPNEKTETNKWPIPNKEGLHFNFGHSNGLCYELAAVRECLLKGLTECPEVPWEESITIAEILEEVRLQLGVKYPQTKKDDDKKC
uniref:Trans-1,2-dihydrobenzene-1,2-diol dehydrogenase n=1 Tax=Plectus sambesii TaxID=2011161 RepID=A0A914W4N8_9BILA